MTVLNGDCREQLATLEDNTIDACVTDPPYELGFMGKAWDASGVAYDPKVWGEVWRVLKPGAYLLAFGGTRTYHRLACAVEDAGFEVRDSIAAWIYSTGFPKSLDVSKAIDKAAGAEREVVGLNPNHRPVSGVGYEGVYSGGNTGASIVTAPATDEAARWEGFGTSLKPAWEPVIVARKPLAGTVAHNVTVWGVGGLNIDGCRVATSDDLNGGGYSPGPGRKSDSMAGHLGHLPGQFKQPQGRWPANTVLAHHPDCDTDCHPDCWVRALDRQSGVRPGSHKQRHLTKSPTAIGGGLGCELGESDGYGDSGGASRFFPTFRYEPKAPTRERPKVDGVAHPTVKPLALIRWLCRLVTPPGGLILDPFLGSGTTAEAAELEGFRWVGCESNDDYLPLIQARLDRAVQPPLPMEASA